MKKILYIIGAVITFMLSYYAAAILISLAFIAYYMSQDYPMSGTQLFNIILYNHSYAIVILSFTLLTAFYMLFYKLKKCKISELIQVKAVTPASIVISVFIGFSFYLILRYCLSFLIGDEQSFYINLSDIYNIKILDKSSLTYVLSTLIALPALEEITHRGILFSILNRRLSLGLSLIIQALVYALIYTKPHVMLYIFILGLIAGIVYNWHKCILLPIVIHLSFNAAALIVNTAFISKFYDTYDTVIFIVNAALLFIYLLFLYRLSVRNARKNLTLVK
ncbi:MAG: family intrarane metalloprotease [Clostridia bacterium]|jgi:membrane protease YdiL (CAAX protease family)|nr:family intrarane metalloprotease [Clostridia bacterium]